METAALAVPMQETAAAGKIGSDAAPSPAWADMDTDCLAHVFRRLDLEDLAAAAPLVCRGWRRAAADPSLWRALDLRRDHVARFMPWAPLAAAFARRYGVTRFAAGGFLRVCVARAQGSADDVALPPLLASPAADLDHISIQCPRLRRLALPHLPAGDDAQLPDLIPRWPLLEHLELDAKPSTTFPALAAQLGRHCPNFASLKTSGAVKPEDAAALARSLPRLRTLRLDRSYVPKQELLAILAGCQDLRELSARGCVGFDEGDEEVARRGARIERFDVAGSRMIDELQDELAGGPRGTTAVERPPPVRPHVRPLRVPRHRRRPLLMLRRRRQLRRQRPERHRRAEPVGAGGRVPPPAHPRRGVRGRRRAAGRRRRRRAAVARIELVGGAAGPAS